MTRPPRAPALALAFALGIAATLALPRGDARAADAPPAAAPAKTAALTVSFVEPGGRIKIGEQKLDAPLDAKAHETALSLGGSVEGYKLRTLAREVKITGAAGTAAGVFVEITVLAKDGTETGYLSVTMPAEPSLAFSASTKFKGAKGASLLAVLTR